MLQRMFTPMGMLRSTRSTATRFRGRRRTDRPASRDTRCMRFRFTEGDGFGVTLSGRTFKPRNMKEIHRPELSATSNGCTRPISPSSPHRPAPTCASRDAD